MKGGPVLAFSRQASASGARGARIAAALRQVAQTNPSEAERLELWFVDYCNLFRGTAPATGRNLGKPVITIDRDDREGA